jgi:ABC-2 type transport system permease protein
MEAVAANKPVTINRWLPYWAVFQADVRQTLHSWAYLLWVFLLLLGTAGYLLYRFSPYHQVGIVQSASAFLSDLLRWTVFGSGGLIVVLTAGTISSERGTMADSVLSRGISRYQYFMGKWHARLATVLGTYLIVGVAAILSSVFLLHEDLSPGGSIVALLTICALLGTVVSFGVAISALVNSTMLGVTMLWVLVYGGAFALCLLPARYPSPHRLLRNLHHVLRGHYDLEMLAQLAGWCALFSCVLAVIGMAYFARRDV